MAILVNSQPSFLDQLGSGLGQGLGGAVLNNINDSRERKRLEFENAQKEKLLNAQTAQKLELLGNQPAKPDAFEIESQKLSAKRIGDFVNSSKEDSEAASRILNSSSQIRKAFDSGNVGAWTPKNIARNLFSVFGRLPDNADEATVTAAGISFLEKAKPLFGRVSEREVLILKEAIPEIGDTPEGANAKLKVWEDAAKLGVKRGELVNQIIEQNGGVPPRNIESLIDAELKEEREKIFAEASSIGGGGGSVGGGGGSIPEGNIKVFADNRIGSVTPEQLKIMQADGVNPQVLGGQPQEQPAQPQQAQARQPQPAQPQQTTGADSLLRSLLGVGGLGGQGILQGLNNSGIDPMQELRKIFGQGQRQETSSLNDLFGGI